MSTYYYYDRYNYLSINHIDKFSASQPQVQHSQNSSSLSLSPDLKLSVPEVVDWRVLFNSVSLQSQGATDDSRMLFSWHLQILICWHAAKVLHSLHVLPRLHDTEDCIIRLNDCVTSENLCVRTFAFINFNAKEVFKFLWIILCKIFQIKFTMSNISRYRT